ncbi:hypothetical protein CLCR_09924 [Cladophialophora carrionii]|uniref:F-box domain-containing protein n=1 Tax=Cladophialophora carrionii TaxID=86049 RepID=A0A1C1CYG1_9EURO|nr:hypothetical protein CLCR_09924 [Cladophialophora carrionii]
MTSQQVFLTPLHPPTRALPELPNEIFLLLIQRCSGATLKQLRLVSKTLAQLTEPYLWREVVLVPNDHSILGFARALKRSRVLRLVTKITYDARFGAFFTRIKDVSPDPSLPYPAAERSKELSFLDTTSIGHFKPYEDMSIEVACLAKALRLMPNLKEACIREYEDEPSNGIPAHLTTSDIKVPSFYLRLCKKMRVDPEKVSWSTMVGASGRSYAKGFITAAFSADCRLQELKAKGIDGRAMFGVVPMKSSALFQQVNIFKNATDSLRYLEFSFRNDTLISTANHIEAVREMLRSAKRLRTLRLKLTDCSTSHHHYADEDLMSDFCGLVESSTGIWLCKPLLPKLENLIIDACICHDEDLMHFLRIHSGTLRRLELSNITLLGGDDRRECWVRMIKHLKTELKLASISFSGWFSNGGRQQWSVARDPVGPERLKAKVEKYVIDRRIRVCPLEPVAIKPNEGDVEKPANGEEFEGDLTWTMVYSNRHTDHVDWQPTEPSFGINSPTVSSQTSEAGDSTPLPGHSESDTWGEPEPENIDAYPGGVQLPDFDTVFGVGSGIPDIQSWSVFSSSPGKLPQATPSDVPAAWYSAPFASISMA